MCINLAGVLRVPDTMVNSESTQLYEAEFISYVPLTCALALEMKRALLHGASEWRMMIMI
jgi:hypothetical protein